uniref:Uncharacterized protein n=1 Tax=Anguilla anguilla TaxID=7936 RepID=A0A0E9RQU3_ANGAN
MPQENPVKMIKMISGHCYSKIVCSPVQLSVTVNTIN